MKLRTLLAAAAMSLAAGGSALADAIPYPSSGTYNETTYTFNAQSTGDLVAYIIGGFGASYDNQLGVLVNGVAQGGFGLDNHSSSFGSSYNFGAVNAGDVLTFVLHDNSVGKDAFSDPALNVVYDNPGSAQHNHVYSTSYSGNATPAVPSGVYVAFEDIPFPGGDYNYNDESFVFQNTSATVSAAPEPGTWALMFGGLGVLGGALRLRKAYREENGASDLAAV